MVLAHVALPVNKVEAGLGSHTGWSEVQWGKRQGVPRDPTQMPVSMISLQKPALGK